MKTQERIVITKNQEFRWIDVKKTDSGFAFINNVRTKSVKDSTIFQDDLIIFEPSFLYKGRQKEYVSCQPKHISIKWVAVKTRYFDKFEEILKLYSKLTNQNIQVRVVRKEVLFKNSTLIVRLSKCKLDKFPTKIDLNFEEIKNELESIFKQKEKESTKKRYLIKNKIIEL